MDALSQVLAMWKDEAIVIVVTFMAVFMFHRVTKLWSAPADAVLGAILGASVGVVGSVLYLTRHLWRIDLSMRALCFIALYLWCVLGMIFFAKHTHRIKVFLGLVSQAGILYALFIFL